MGFPLDGFVLRAPRTAPSNAISTDEAVNGVERDFKPPVTSAFGGGEAPELVEVAADQYRAAVLLRPDDGQTEYLIWAANTADLSTLEIFEADSDDGSIRALYGTLEVENQVSDPDPEVYEDGTLRFYVSDSTNASIAAILQFKIARGDTDDTLVLTEGFYDFNPVTSIVTITDEATIQALSGGFSPLRRDRLGSLRYTRAAVRFWWSKNDRYATRFQWNGLTQRWEPLKGTAPRNLGTLLADGTYTAIPNPNVPAGEYLPGNSVDPDSYSMIRVGVRPDSGSTPVAEPVSVTGYGGILVVADDEVEEYDFPTNAPTAAGVMGQSSGELLWNPGFVNLFAGQSVFYCYQSFLTEGDAEAVGKLETSEEEPLFLSPVPGVTDYPFVRIGNRTPLEALMADTEALLAVTAVSEGQVGIALSTGKLKFSQVDIDKSDPESTTFDTNWLGAEVFYDGLSLTRSPLKTKAPVRLVDGSGDPTTISKDQRLYIPDAEPQPAPGVSGVQFEPDLTGTIPDPAIDPSIRYNKSGLVRDVRGDWDLVLFTTEGRITSVRVVDDPEDEVPRFKFRIPQGRAYIDLNRGSGGSEVILGKKDRQRFAGEPMWFLQSGVQPAVYASEARICSRVRGSFDLVGTERLKFAIQNNIYLWNASADPGGVATSAGGTFTAEEIATSLDAVITGQGSAVVVGSCVVLQTDLEANGKQYGEIEVGWGPVDTKDLSGAAALGFLPGWHVRVSNPPSVDDLHFLPDSGTHLGVYRSPLNISGRRDDIADIGHRDRLEDTTLSENIAQIPVVLLDKIPLEDQPGYDDGVFFRLQTGFFTRDLQNYDEVLHQFGEGKFTWVDENSLFGLVPRPTTELGLGASSLVPDSFRLPGKGLKVSADGGPFVEQELDTDFKLLLDGQPGIATLIQQVGDRVALGARGTVAARGTTFEDNSPDVDFVALGVTEGYQLKLLTGAEAIQGTYIVTADATNPKQLQVKPAFLDDSSSVTWELFVGVDEDTNDPGIVADAHYLQFNHLLEEPFKIRTLTDLGDVPVDATTQEASRLQANISRALASEREIDIRFGQPNGSPTATLRRLEQEFLGEIVNSGLYVPDPSGERFVNEDFSIRVGTKLFTFAAGDLVKVPPPVTFPLTGNIIEVEDGSGLLNFGAEVFAELAQSDVYYVEEFADPAASPTVLPAGVAEYRIDDGLLNFSADDMAQYGGTTTAYFVQQMVTENGQDVTISPLQGSILFNTPIDEQTIVEVEYFQAQVGSGELALDNEGDPIQVIEFVPLFVDQEEATLPPVPPGSIVPADYGRRWDFNPTERTVREDIDATIYVGNNLANVGGAVSPQVEIDYEANQLILKQPVDQNTKVTITYAVNESFGGEQSYTVSTIPVYRPPFRIPANTDEFVLEGDRTGDVIAGKLLRVGEFPFYIKESTYDASANSTTVEIFPPTQPNQEPGTLAPGHDVLSLLTERPIAKQYNTAADDGIWKDIPNEYEPVNRGFVSVTFFGNLVEDAITGYLLEIGGYPFIIAGATLSEDGNRTTIDLTSPTPEGFVVGQDAVRVTIRPVYQPAPMNFLGLGPVSREDVAEVVLFGETDDSGNVLPGRTLKLSTEYTLDYDSGTIDFLAPQQAPLRPGQTLYLRHTRLRVLAPFVRDEVVVTPRYFASYVNGIVPSEDNGILGQVLRAEYTFASPDTWFYRTAPLLDYLGEVGESLQAGISAQLPSRGAVVAIPPAVENDTEGNLGLRAQISDLEDQDRAARTFIEFYNNVILAYEQVLETISGNVIGDRDGKFKFFVGRGKELAPPGYEDAITGNLNTRNIFSELFFAYNRHLIHLTRDPLVEPITAELQGDQIVGDFLDPDRLADLFGEMREIIHNDVDDLVLVSRTRKRVRRKPLRYESFGRYDIAGEPNKFSRLFPERATAFTLTDPGLLADLESDPVDPGVYAFRKKLTKWSFKGGIQRPKRGSTFRKSIGIIGNPVLGQMTGITSITVTDRLPRARVFAYSETGFPDLDSSFESDPRPAVIATVLPLHEFPIRDDGLPDVSQLEANGGELPDLTTGDSDLITPAFTTFDRDDRRFPQIAIGRPTGEIIDIVSATSVNIGFGDFTVSIPQKVFVGEVLQGCILTFVTSNNSTGDPILDSTEILEAGDEPEDATPLTLERGDTIFITPPDVDIEPADPSENEQRAAEVKGLPSYRVDFDLRVNDGDGVYEDNTLPSILDPSIFFLKELLGQKPPDPLSHLEAEVSFRNSLTDPLEIPALTGGYTNDSGDYTLPYLYVTNTEIDRLGEAKAAFATIVSTDAPAPRAVYPDEIQGTDGQVLASLSFGGEQPAALLTSLDATPVTTAGGYTPGSGVGDVAPYDLLLIETPQSEIPIGAQGIINLGTVEGGASGSRLHPARFVTATSAGARFRYEFLAMQTYVNQPPTVAPPGMVVSVAGPTTTFDVTSVSPGFIVFNDGNPPPSPTGGLNDIVDPGGPFAYPANDNRIRINIWTADDTVNPVVFVGYIEIAMNGVGVPTADAPFSGLGPQTITSPPPFFDQQTLSFQTAAPFLTVGFGPTDVPEDISNPGFSRPLWFTVDVDTTSAAPSGGASLTGYIDNDRTTFREGIDMRGVLDRGTPALVGQPVHGRLRVEFVEGPGGQDAITVNNPAEVNGGVPFTFLNREFSFPTIGSFDLNTGRGSIKVMGFEGHGNTPLPSTGEVVFSAIPSWSQDENGTIAYGTGTSAAATFNPDFDNRVAVLTEADVTSGNLANVEAGDILTIASSDDTSARATTKAGTYLVKHAIQPLAGGWPFATYGLTTNTNPINTGAGWLQVQFPRLVSVNTLTKEITITSARLDNGTDAWPPATNRIYLIPDVADIASVVSVEYTAVDFANAVFTYDDTTVEDANGGGLTEADLVAVAEDSFVSGFWAAEVRMDRAGAGLPRNLVGYRTPGPDNTAYGFGGVRFFNPKVPASTAVILTFGGGQIIEGGTPAANEIRVTDHTPIVNTSFVNDPDAIVYPSVAENFLWRLSQANWDLIHDGAAQGAAQVNCLFPGDQLNTETAIPAFRAQAGVFLEPSIPRPVFDLGGVSPKVVDANNSLLPADIGFRDAVTYGMSEPERVRFEVRRIRRFHLPLTDASQALLPLQYAYQIRRGVVTTYGPDTLPPTSEEWPYVIETIGGTTLGDFLDENVNINPGDMFRLLDSDGTLLDEVEIAGIPDENRLALAAPGISAVSAANVNGKAFEIYLRAVPVPHEQSNEQLLDLVADEVLIERTADYGAQTGGWVPIEASSLDPRRVRDTDGSVNFAGAGVEEGDIVLIDGAGDLSGPGGIPITGQERGARPFGDRSVPNRTVATPGQEVPFIAGAPSELDDNRGFYRVSEVASESVTIDPTTTFSGENGGSFITFGDQAEYAVYPTVSDSTAPFADPPGGPGVEGQMDLRPTSFAGENGSPADSYLDNLFSIAPFSYRIIRPSALLSDEAVDLILLMRERTLSFIDAFNVFFTGTKEGSYFIFQRDAHISDLGNPLIPDEGLGVMSNALIQGVAGLTQISPFANTTDALSVLDRRFWVADTRLDAERPQPGDPTYSTFETNDGNPSAAVGDGRPVLPDRITEVLDNSDQFRPLRLSWLNFRVNREDGILVTLNISRSRFSKNRRRQIRQLQQAKSLEDAQS